LLRLLPVGDGETRTYFARHMTKDGRVFDVEVTATSIRFNGRAARLVMATDLTERRRVEESLHRIQDRFKRALASSGAVIYELDIVGTEMHVAWMSESVLLVLGYTPEEAGLPQWWPYRVHPDDLARLNARGPDARMSETPHEYRFRHKDGRYRWLRDEQRIVRDAGGQPRSVIGALIDVTATHDLQEQLSPAAWHTTSTTCSRSSSARSPCCGGSPKPRSPACSPASPTSRPPRSGPRISPGNS
jgi:PAS domain S-box-containing protein